MKLDEFFHNNPVFTLKELDRFLESRNGSNRKTRNALLAYHLKTEHLIRVRRGLYYVVPPGKSPQGVTVDPFLIASKMTDDAVVGYHTALAFYGKSHSLRRVFYCLSKRKSVPLKFRSYEFHCLLYPKTLRSKRMEHFGVETRDRLGTDVRVTCLERTLVDVLDKPELGGGWEEIWRSLEGVEFFDLDKVVQYALLLQNSTTIAKTGFFMDQHRESLMVEEVHLEPLRERRPRKPHYMSRSQRVSGRFLPDWNLVVPEQIIRRSWGEVT